MIESLKPYEKSKDSGCPWFGRVPSHWSVVPLNTVATPKSVKNNTDRELLSVYLHRGVIRFSDVKDKRTNPTSTDLSNYQAVDPGDFVLNNQQAWRGSVGVSQLTGIVSPAYLVLTLSPEIDSKFANLLFRDRAMVSQYVVASKGVGSIQRNLYWPHLKRAATLLPPPEEQAAIVRFLDHADRKIRQYIRAKRRLIELLNEQEEAIIHQAVTRGLDSNVKLKPSHMYWLGDIPEHWTAKRFKFVTRITSGQVDPRNDAYKNMVLVAPNHIRSGEGHVTHEETADEQGADSGKYFVQAGEIIYSKIRPNLRKAAIARTNCLCSADMYPLAIHSEIDPKYFLLVLLSKPFTRYVVDCSLRVAMPKVNRESLAESVVWFPEKAEQQEIVKKLESVTKQLNQTAGKAQQEIQFLGEYRTRLIADVVTGKLDIRDAAATLPEGIKDVEEDQLLDEESEIGNELLNVPEEA